jgi:tRNA A37 methylthiotransferase MiaB
MLIYLQSIKINLDFKKKVMETLEQIKTLVEELSVDTTKFFKGNNSAGTRARKMAQDIKNLLQKLRTEILDERKKEGNE